ncbi:3-deoxy-D-manno-octulosonic acid kinase [Halomonas halocynthiae]|uniref:3-deoxy-D-manno-octulosonic acid kinase n=1 Tax=Halomonas halocynthiae TaxID=176290 RepID=UPI000409ADAB|nr:3-deoxy-D-manno-octulosonic acid kinase [Halomonas halocynthiae]
MRLATFQTRKTCILYDAERLCDAKHYPRIQVAHFTPDFWRNQQRVLGTAPGRGSSVFINPSNLSSDPAWVLRPYLRGGMAAKISRQRYLWTGLERTRAFCEMRLLAKLYQQGLPVPRPVGACVTRAKLTWSGALITVCIPQARTLADLVLAHGADSTLLEQVGSVIRRFHEAGLDHVDLNARNLLIDAENKVWLIDLDRCRLRRPGRWQSANLARLGRSLARFDNASDSAMADIQLGYRNVSSS